MLNDQEILHPPPTLHLTMSVQEGIYVLQAVNSDKGIAIGPIPLIYPPPTVPVRILGGYFLDKWRLVRQDGGFAITDRNPRGGYSIIRKGDTAFVSWEEEGFPKAWAIERAGDNTVVIKEPTEDRVFTYDENTDRGAGVTLQPANGSDAQRWTLIRLGDD